MNEVKKWLSICKKELPRYQKYSVIIGMILDHLPLIIMTGEILSLIPISMTPGVGYEECIDKMFYSTPYRFYHYVDEANERLDSGHKIDRNKIKILKNERFGTLRVRLQVGT